MPAGRPSSYNDDTAKELCEHIAKGMSLRELEMQDGMPSIQTIYRWIDGFPQFREQYARAKQDQSDYLASEIVEIADTEPDPQKARVRIDARKWVAAKLKPKVYGDIKQVTQDVNVSGDITHLLGSIAGSTKTALPGQAEELTVEHAAPQQALEVEYTVVSDDADKGK